MLIRFKLSIVLMLSIIRRSKTHDSGADDRNEEDITKTGQEWQYEGMPIEVPSRRIIPGFIDETKIVSPSTEPPLDDHYRRIFNADALATIEDYPFLAALLVNNQLWCGGAIIDTDKILTAAHCLQLQYNNRFFREYVKMLSVRLGSSNSSAGGEVFRVIEIFFHPNYKPYNLEFNFAVIKIHANISRGMIGAEPIPYSTKAFVPTDSQITFLGWGSVLGIGGGKGGKVLLQKIKLPVYDLADCQEIYGRALVTKNNFCAGFITKAKNVCNKIACFRQNVFDIKYNLYMPQHDAGGPAIMDGVLVGVLSFSSKRCDRPDKPAVFSSVGQVAPWIQSLSENRIKFINTEMKVPM